MAIKKIKKSVSKTVRKVQEAVRPRARLHAVKFGLAWAIVLAVLMLIMSITAITLNYGMVWMMLAYDLYGFLGFNLTALGIVLGTIYVFIDVFVISWLFAVVYNKLL